MTKPYMDLPDRFNLYVNKQGPGGCWIWTGGRQRRNRYGTFGVDGRMLLAHRVSYTIHKGEIPCGLHVLHKCDVPYCVNPDHLFVGTHWDNMADKERKGRGNQLRGQKHANAKLTESDVYYIRSSSETANALAARFGVSFGLIGHVRKRRAWKHI